MSNTRNSLYNGKMIGIYTYTKFQLLELIVKLKNLTAKFCRLYRMDHDLQKYIIFKLKVENKSLRLSIKYTFTQNKKF